MDMRGFFIVAIVCTFAYYCKAQEEQPMKLSEDEVLEIENQLEKLNKSSVKTIKVFYYIHLHISYILNIYIYI